VNGGVQPRIASVLPVRIEEPRDAHITGSARAFVEEGAWGLALHQPKRPQPRRRERALPVCARLYDAELGWTLDPVAGTGEVCPDTCRIGRAGTGKREKGGVGPTEIKSMAITLELPFDIGSKCWSVVAARDVEISGPCPSCMGKERYVNSDGWTFLCVLCNGKGKIKDSRYFNGTYYVAGPREIYGYEWFEDERFSGGRSLQASLCVDQPMKDGDGEVSLRYRRVDLKTLFARKSDAIRYCKERNAVLRRVREVIAGRGTHPEDDKLHWGLDKWANDLSMARDREWHKGSSTWFETELWEFEEMDRIYKEFPRWRGFNQRPLKKKSA